TLFYIHQINLVYVKLYLLIEQATFNSTSLSYKYFIKLYINTIKLILCKILHITSFFYKLHKSFRNTKLSFDLFVFNYTPLIIYMSIIILKNSEKYVKPSIFFQQV